VKLRHNRDNIGQFAKLFCEEVMALDMQTLTLAGVQEKVSSTVINYPYADRIAKVGLFGSFARGEATDESDLDFVIDFQYKYSGDSGELMAEVEKKFQFDELLQEAFSPISLSIITTDGLPYAGNHFVQQLNEDVIWVYEQK